MTVELVPLTDGEYDGWRAGAARRLATRRYRSHTDDPAAASTLAEAQLERALPDGPATAVAHVVAVVRGGTRVGTLCWLLLGDGEQAAVLDLVLDDLSVVDGVRTAVIDAAGAAGAAALNASVFPGDPVSEAFGRGSGFTVRATTMQIDLTGRPIEDDDRVELRRMTPAEFEVFMQGETESYAEARMKSGESATTATRIAHEQMAQLLPDGLDSPGVQLWHAYDGGTQVGMLWIDTSKPRAFVYNVEVDEAQQRRGYGRAIMTAGAAWCQGHGSIALGLNVFGYNDGARALYDQLGYTVTEDSVALDL